MIQGSKYYRERCKTHLFHPENPLEDLEKAQKYIEILIQKHTPYPTQKDKMAMDYKEALAKLKAGEL